MARAVPKKQNSFSQADSEDGLCLLSIAGLPDTKNLGGRVHAESLKDRVEVVSTEALSDIFRVSPVSKVSEERVNFGYAELTHMDG